MIFLQWLRFGQTCENLRMSFKLGASRVQTAINDLWNPTVEIMTDNFIPRKPIDYISLKMTTINIPLGR